MRNCPVRSQMMVMMDGDSSCLDSFPTDLGNTEELERLAKLKNDMGETMPTMDDFLQLRNKINVHAEFTVGTFYPILVGKHKFDWNVVTNPVSSHVAISDEAFFC